jgi:hypothetical protein
MTRRRPTRTEKEAILERQTVDGVTLCAECMREMSGASAIEFDHRRIGLPRWYFAQDPTVDPDDPDDMEALHAKCHRKRTNTDLAIIAKDKRRNGETGQRSRRLRGATQKIAKHVNPWGYR